MKLIELYTAQLAREAAISRRILERYPDGKKDWTPHPKSMPLGYLATLVATMPTWLAMTVQQDSLDLNPPGGSQYRPPSPGNAAEMVAALDEATAKARSAFQGTTEEHLMTPWKLMVAGRVVMEQPRHVVVEDTFAHLAHHRGQLSVYLRLNDVPLPSLYGPTADDKSFG